MSVPVRPPNFEDERTVLSARPVVPLTEIEAKVRRRRRWFLGGAFAVAMMLGAASALLASYLKLQNVPTAASDEMSLLDIAPAPVAKAENPPPSEPAVTEETGQPAEALLEAPKKEPVTRRRTVVKHDQEPEEARDLPNLAEDEELHRIRDAVLYDEWQERRARRVFRRERRRPDRFHHRDLSNLDEIFEGRRP